jgi:hypothetical protein
VPTGQRCGRGGLWSLFGTVSLLADFVYESGRSITERVGKAVHSPAKDTLLS